jgi:hypothetical protein
MVQALLFRDSSQQKTKTELHVVYSTEQLNSVVEHLCAENNFYEFIGRALPQYLLEAAPDDIKSRKPPTFSFPFSL